MVRVRGLFLSLGVAAFLLTLSCNISARTQDDPKQDAKPSTPAPQPQEKADKKRAQEKPPQEKNDKNAAAPKGPSPADELQQAIASAGTDRASLVRNLEAYLKKYPESPQRPQIYRALVEATLQLQNNAAAADYAERIVALTPDDMSMTLVAIQLLQRTGDQAALKRAVSYAGRVLDFVDHTAMDDKSPKMSAEEWKQAKSRDHAAVLLLRGQLYLKLKDHADAQKDFEASYAEHPDAGAAEKLGEVAELNKDLPLAIKQYSRAFALAEGVNDGVSRIELRRKIGNVWRLAHGSDDGLGEYLLHSYDEVTAAAAAPKPQKNADAKEVSAFTLRKFPDGAPFSLASTKGDVTVVSFWATWCGPCRALEPQFENVAAQFKGQQHISFIEANCDEDETQVAPYIEEVKPHVPVVFADGLDRFLSVNSLPTVVIIDQAGKVAFRSEGYTEEGFEKELSAAARRTLSASGSTPAQQPATATPASTSNPSH
jgi:thiol-disulfide isomerase/thioredoxin